MMKIGKAFWSNVFLVGLIVFILLYWQQCQKTKEVQISNKDLQDWNNNTNLVLNGVYSENAILTGQSRSQLLQIEDLTGAKKVLQDMLEKNKRMTSGLVSQIDILVKASGSSTIIKWDTIDNNIYPTYHALLVDSFSSIDMTMGKDTAWAKIELEATFKYRQEWRRESGLFGRKMPYIVGEVNNPYISFTALESMEIKKKPSRLGIGATVGPGINLLTGQAGLMLSGGISYTIR